MTPPSAEPSAIVYVVELTTFSHPFEDDDSYTVEILGVCTSREAAEELLSATWVIDADAWDQTCRGDDNGAIVWQAWLHHDKDREFRIMPFHLNGKYCLVGEFPATSTQAS